MLFCTITLRSIIIHSYTIGGILTFLILEKCQKIKAFKKFYLRNPRGKSNTPKTEKTLKNQRVSGFFVCKLKNAVPCM